MENKGWNTQTHFNCVLKTVTFHIIRLLMKTQRQLTKQNILFDTGLKINTKGSHTHTAYCRLRQLLPTSYKSSTTDTNIQLAYKPLFGPFVTYGFPCKACSGQVINMLQTFQNKSLGKITECPTEHQWTSYTSRLKRHGECIASKVSLQRK
jgi:hypothetical protein